MRRCSIAPLVVLLFASPASAAIKDIAGVRIVVEGGEHDRVNVPVAVELRLEPEIKLPDSVQVTTRDGTVIPAQWVQPGLLAFPDAIRLAAVAGTSSVRPEPADGPPLGGKPTLTRVYPLRAITLYFILPKLAAGTSETLTISKGAERPGYAQRDSLGKHSDLTFGERPVLRYIYQPIDETTPERRAATFKVFHHVYSPDGKQLLTEWDPKGLFPHHRGIFYGFSRVTYDVKEQVDTWHCTKDTHQLHKRFATSGVGPVLGRETAEIAWNGHRKKTFATEVRELTTYNVPGGTMIDFVSELTPTKGNVKLDGDPQHAGLHFRASSDVAASAKDQTYYLRPDGKGERGKFRNWDPKQPDSPESKHSIDVPWKGMSIVVGGKRYTVLLIDHPKNPKPARFSERDYGRFGSYFVAEATSEKPLTVRYRFWIQEGEMTVEQAAAKAADFVDPVKAVAK